MERSATAIAAAVDVVGGRIDAVAAEAAERVHAAIPELPSDPRSVAGTRRAIARGMASTLEALRRSAFGETTDEAIAAEIGALEIDAALPQSARAVRLLARSDAGFLGLVRIVQTVHRTFLAAWDEALAQVEPDPQLLMEAMRASRRSSFAWVEGIEQRLTEELEREADRLARSGESRRLTALNALLAHELHDDPDPVSRRLGYDLRRHHVAMILWGGSADDAERVAEELCTAAGGDPRPLVVPVTASVTRVWIGFARPPERQRLASLSGREDGISVAVGDPGHGAAGFRQSFRNASDAFQVALLTHRPPGSVTAYATVELAGVLAGDVERAARFVRRRLGPLAVDNDDNARLRGTLKVFLDSNRSRHAAAQRLRVHANTVGNRVRACEDILGEDLGGRPTEVHVALAIAELLGDAVLE